MLSTKTRATSINFAGTHFKSIEWPVGVLDSMDSKVINVLFKLRAATGVSMSPSKLARAHVRAEKGKGRHCLFTEDGKPRLSDATDVHVKDHTSLLKVLLEAQKIQQVGGIGIYFDTNTPMFHIDTRPRTFKEPLTWIRYDGKYVYLQNDYVKFFEILGAQLK